MDFGLLASLILVIGVVLLGGGYVFVRGKAAHKTIKERQRTVLPEE